MTFQNLFVRMAVVACPLLGPSLHAQVTATAAAAPISETENQRFDILGGAAYSHFNPGFAHQVQATNLLGWQGSATAWVSNPVGIEATARGVYGTYNLPVNSFNLPATSSLSETLFLFGPSARLYQSLKYTAGVHALIGGAYGSFGQGLNGSGIQPLQIGVYNNQLAFAYAIGGWADYKVYPHFAIRFTADYQPTSYTPGPTQNEFFGAVGIVYKLGHRK